MPYYHEDVTNFPDISFWSSVRSFFTQEEVATRDVTYLTSLRLVWIVSHLSARERCLHFDTLPSDWFAKRFIMDKIYSADGWSEVEMSCILFGPPSKLHGSKTGSQIQTLN